MESIPYMGELCALFSPLAWSVAVILFQKSGESVPPAALNLFKNLVGLALFAITWLALGGGAAEGVDWRHYALLLGSGVVGVGLADLFFLMCLNRLGAGRQAIVNTAYSPPIILLSWIFLGEALSAWQLIGVALILCAVLIVGLTKDSIGARRVGTVGGGILCGLAACLAQAVSIVMVKPFLDDWPLIWTTTWRLFGGVLACLVMIAAAKPEERDLAPFRQPSTWRVMFPAVVIGTYLSLLLWMAGFKYTDASVAAPLNQTATLFTFALAVIWLGEPVTRRRVGGLLCGMVGVALVTFLGAGAEDPATGANLSVDRPSMEASDLPSAPPSSP